MAPQSYPGSLYPTNLEESLSSPFSFCSTLISFCCCTFPTLFPTTNPPKSSVFHGISIAKPGDAGFLVVNSSPIGLAYHASDAGTPPKIRYRTALELDDIPAIRAEDEGFWMMLVTWMKKKLAGTLCFFFCLF